MKAPNIIPIPDMFIRCVKAHTGRRLVDTGFLFATKASSEFVTALKPRGWFSPAAQMLSFGLKTIPQFNRLESK